MSFIIKVLLFPKYEHICYLDDIDIIDIQYFYEHFILRSLNSPPVLNLIYNYDENGVILKHNQDINETFLDGYQDLASPSANMTILWNLSKNGSVEMDNLVDLRDVFVGKEIHFHSIILVPFGGMKYLSRNNFS